MGDLGGKGPGCGGFRFVANDLSYGGWLHGGAYGALGFGNCEAGCDVGALVLFYSWRGSR